MCNRTDCAGVFMGELACRVCEDGKMRLSNEQLKALEAAEAGKCRFRFHRSRGWQCPECTGRAVTSLLNQRLVVTKLVEDARSKIIEAELTQEGRKALEDARNG